MGLLQQTQGGLSASTKDKLLIDGITKGSPTLEILFVLSDKIHCKCSCWEANTISGFCLEFEEGDCSSSANAGSFLLWTGGSTVYACASIPCLTQGFQKDLFMQKPATLPHPYTIGLLLIHQPAKKKFQTSLRFRSQQNCPSRSFPAPDISAFKCWHREPASPCNVSLSSPPCPLRPSAEFGAGCILDPIFLCNVWSLKSPRAYTEQHGRHLLPSIPPCGQLAAAADNTQRKRATQKPERGTTAILSQDLSPTHETFRWTPGAFSPVTQGRIS